MDFDSPSPNKESNEQKAEFRKPTNETSHRNYRRRSPIAGMSDEDGSPKHDHSYRRNSKTSDYEKRNDDRVDDRLSSGSQHGRHNDSYRHSSRGTRYDEHSRYGKHVVEDDRSHAKSSYRSSRESKSGTHSDSRDCQGDYNRSRDRYRDVDRYSRDRSDKYKEKESSSDRVGYHGSRCDDRDRYSREKDHRNGKEYRSSRDPDNVKDVNGIKESKYVNDSTDTVGRKGEHMSASVSEDFASKRPKLFSSENTESRKVVETTDTKLVTDQAAVNASDPVASADAAKVAAMKAAELVNKNLTGMGIMTADQKKKLLWGSKKSATTEETSHRWDSAMFSDRERQEKFNKLMGVKGEVKTVTKPVSSQDAEKLQVDLEKQYTAGLRRRDGRTVGLGL